MAMKSGKSDGIFNEINITPLTDIFLVLLIIMMLIAPMFQSLDEKIALPGVNSGAQVDEKEVTVSVTKEANFFVNTKSVADKDLAEELKALLEEAKDKKVVVKADVSTKTSEIMKVMKAAQEAGYEKLTVAGEPLGPGQQKKLEEKEPNEQS